MRDKDTGVVAEMQVASKLIEDGYTVSEPINDGKYDLVAEKGGEFTRIQVKNGRMKNGSVRATLCEYSRGDTYVYGKDDIDAFGIYNSENGVFFMDVEDAPEQLVHIRVEEAEMEQPTIRYAEDYREL